jgi:hypothetical protein
MPDCLPQRRSGDFYPRKICLKLILAKKSYRNVTIANHLPDDIVIAAVPRCKPRRQRRTTRRSCGRALERHRRASRMLGLRSMISSALASRVGAPLQQTASYSIISAARASTPCGRVRPSAFTVFRLIRSSNLMG